MRTHASHYPDGRIILHRDDDTLITLSHREVRAIENALHTSPFNKRETGPENCREEVAPMGQNTTRDWSIGPLGAAHGACTTPSPIGAPTP